eukprot:Clim_evm36s199 gene=Clim_evmTU36s199
MPAKDNYGSATPTSAAEVVTPTEENADERTALLSRTALSQTSLRTAATTMTKVSKTGSGSRLKPNYFISWRLRDPQLLEQLLLHQNRIKSLQPKLKSLLVKPTKFHITFGVFTVYTDEEREKAREAFQLCRDKVSALLKEPLTVNFKGVKSISNRVLYASVDDEDHEGVDLLTKISTILRNTMTENGVPCLDNRAFLPHITLAKHRDSKLLKQAPITEQMCDTNIELGTDTLSELELSSMKTVDEVGYYGCLEKIVIASNESSGVCCGGCCTIC